MELTTKSGFAQILAADQQGLDAVAAALGTGDTLKSNLNKNLVDQGLAAASDVSTPTTGLDAAASGGCRTSSWAWAPLWARVLLLAGLASVSL
jgi:hypothetical protein